MDILCPLVGVAVAIFVIAAVVHLLWTLVRNATKAGDVSQPADCPQCANTVGPEAAYCGNCGFRLGEARRPALADELEATKRQLHRLLESGRVSESAVRNILDGIERDLAARQLRKVEQPIAAAAETPSPEPAPNAPVEIARPLQRAEPLRARAETQPPAVPESAVEDLVPPESRGLAGVLQAFMEQRNIRWGELVSGLLIVVSSVGLVISLWATLKEAIPYFPVAVFLAATAAMHGAGLYTLKRWRLKTTSRGLLVISTLLVPLNVLAAIALNDKKPAYGALDYAAVSLGLSALAAIVFSAARVLNKHNPWPMFIAVTGAAAGMSWIGRLAAPGIADWQTLLLFAVPFGSFAVGAVAHVGRLAAGRHLSSKRAAQSFRFLGIALFSLAIATALLAWKSGDVLGTLSLLSPLVSLLGAILSAAGLVVQQRLTAIKDAGFRTAGTAIALGGGLAVTAAVILAWPRPDLLVEVGLLNAVTFSALGWLAVMPALHLFATASFSLACLVGFQWTSGRISIGTATSDRLSELLLEARSALVLAVLSLFVDGAGLLLARTKARLHAAGHLASAILQAGFAVAIAAFAVLKGLPDQNLATAVFFLLALRWLVAAWWVRRAYATWIGAALLLAAFAHGLAMNSAVAAALSGWGLQPADPWTMAFLLHAAICAAYAAAARLARPAEGQAGSSPHDALVMPLSVAAVVVSAVTIPAMLDVSADRSLVHAGYAFGTAVIWFAVACIHGAPVLAGAAQAISTIGIVYGVIAYCRTQDWWTGSYIEPRHLNWQFSALAVWSGSWIALRHFFRRLAALAHVFGSEPFAVDRLVLGTVVAGLTVTCSLAIAPGILAQEALRGATAASPLPFYLLMVAPFFIGVLASAARALFASRWQQSAAAFGLGIVAVLCFARILEIPTSDLWPGFPSPYGQGWGAGVWAALAVVMLALILAHWERPTPATFGGIACVLATLPFLFACRWDTQLATASALCWSSAVAALAISVLWCGRKPIAELSQRFGWTSPDSPAWKNSRYVRNALIASTGFSILSIVAGNMLSLVGEGRFTAGAFADSFFAHFGPAAADGVPLAILAASFVLYAVAERNALWGMSATFLAQSAFGLVACYWIALGPRWAEITDFVTLLEEMGLAAGVAAACWLAIEELISRRFRSATAGNGPLRASILLQFGLAATFALMLTAEATYGLWIFPAPLLKSVEACGSPLGWNLLALVAGIWCVLQRAGWPRSAAAPAVAFFAAASPLAAASLSTWNRPDNWISFHTAIAGWCGLIGATALWALIATVRRTARASDFGPSTLDLGPARGRVLEVADWTLLLTPLVTLFAFRGLWGDPLRPWWSAGSMLWVSLCAIVLAALAASRSRAYFSLVFAALGSVFIGLRPWMVSGSRTTDQDALDLVHITLIGMAVHALVWTVIRVLHERRRPPVERPASFPAPHHVVALLGTVLAGLPALAVVIQRLLPFSSQGALSIVPASALGWTALALLAILCAASLWERGTRHGLRLLYVLGLAALATGLSRIDLSRHEFVVTAVCSLAGYVVITGGAWALRRPLQAIGLRLGTAADDGKKETDHRWLPDANLALSVLVILAGFWIVFMFQEPGLRIAAALATFGLVPGLALLASAPRQRQMQMDALFVGAIGAAQFGWALMDVGPVPHEELRRTIRLLVSLAATAFLYGVPLIRVVPAAGAWFVSIRRVAVGVAAAAVISLGLILVFEWLSFDPSAGAAVSVTDSIVVAVALAGLAAGLISLAVLPGRDPFLSSEKQRFLYVYGSEAVAGLLFAHLYLTNPQLFRHLLQPYWPLVVMGIAFSGAGIAELFGRLRVNVLAKPVEYTAAFLPVLPMLGFWLVSSDLNYSTTLVAVGVLYLFLALRRGSFVYSAAAAVVGNATLCALFAEHGVSLLVHPQMFIIPPCVTVLAAAQLNRDRLGETTLASVRYFAITTIYVSSTGEMFQHGIGTTLWLPMVLAGLSVLGVLAGIVLRVRAFLYLGVSFLILSLVSMVWHASRSIGHVWPWWVFLFTLGLALLTLFGIFEKKRQEVLVLIDRLRQWEK